MVHNGIEYIDMQLICEAYTLLQDLLGHEARRAVARSSPSGTRAISTSFLIEITADILQQQDPVNKDSFFVDIVLDTAGQKGTGKWTSVNALDMGIPANAIAEAVFARCLSRAEGRARRRVARSSRARAPKSTAATSRSSIDAVRDALYCSKICAYAQGFQLMREAQKEYKLEAQLRRDRRRSGAAAASSARASCRRSPRPTRAIRSW